MLSLLLHLRQVLAEAAALRLLARHWLMSDWQPELSEGPRQLRPDCLPALLAGSLFLLSGRLSFHRVSWSCISEDWCINFKIVSDV